MAERHQSLRLIAAVLIAPLALIPVVSLHGIVTDLILSDYAFDPTLLMLFVTYGLAIAYPAVVFAGLPAHWALNRLQKTGTGFYAAAGAALTLVGMLVFMGTEALSDRTEALVHSTLLLGCGVAVATSFRLIAKPGHSPDQ